MQSSVTKPSSSAVRVVIGGMTMRFLISTGPMRAGVRRMFIRLRFRETGNCPRAALCQTRRHGKKLFDHLIGVNKELLGDLESRRLSSFQIDYEIVFGRQLYRQIAGLFAA